MHQTCSEDTSYLTATSPHTHHSILGLDSRPSWQPHLNCSSDPRWEAATRVSRCDPQNGPHPLAKARASHRLRARRRAASPAPCAARSPQGILRQQPRTRSSTLALNLFIIREWLSGASARFKYSSAGTAQASPNSAQRAPPGLTRPAGPPLRAAAPGPPCRPRPGYPAAWAGRAARSHLRSRGHRSPTAAEDGGRQPAPPPPFHNRGGKGGQRRPARPRGKARPSAPGKRRRARGPSSPRSGGLCGGGPRRARGVRSSRCFPPALLTLCGLPAGDQPEQRPPLHWRGGVRGSRSTAPTARPGTGRASEVSDSLLLLFWQRT